jgi:hypothetical protein
MSENGSTQKKADAISLSVAPMSARRDGPHAEKVSKTIQSMSTAKPANQPMHEKAPDQSIRSPVTHLSQEAADV